MIGNTFVIDGVVHAYNNLPSNRVDDRYAPALFDLLYSGHSAFQQPGYRTSREAFEQDWTAQDMVNLMFLESGTDLLVHHVLPLDTVWKDGQCSVEKTRQVRDLAPDRVITYAGVDPLEGPAALEKLERQVEILKPVGVKLYPMRYEQHTVGWRMDDPRVAFPVYEKARQLGLKIVSVHKAIPMGPVPMEWFRPDDVDAAAEIFPDLTFEIVHGGMAFTEETAWQLGRFPNVVVNLEVTSSFLLWAPGRFAKTLATLISMGGEGALRRIVWSSAAVGYHPQPLLDAFWAFQFPERVLEEVNVPQLTDEHKRWILGENYARMVGVDISAARAKIADDAFAQQVREHGGLFGPWTTTHANGTQY